MSPRTPINITVFLFSYASRMEEGAYICNYDGLRGSPEPDTDTFNFRLMHTSTLIFGTPLMAWDQYAHAHDTIHRDGQAIGNNLG